MKSKLFFSLSVLLILCIKILGAQDKTFQISGKVTDENGTPMAGAGITVVNTPLGTYSGSDGSYVLQIRNTGTIRLRFSFTGYETAIKEISVPETLVLDVSLVPELP